jgi:hypothetical protein
MPCLTAAPTDSPKAAKEAVDKDEEKAEINSDSSLITRITRITP